MLSYPVLGALCLAALWVTALLVAAAAWVELRALRALRARLHPASTGELGPGLLEGQVARGDSEGGLFARHTVVQIGRALDTPAHAIAFRDQAHESHVFGGLVRVGDTTVRVEPHGSDAVVWTCRRAKERAAEATYADASAFDAAHDAARTPRGVVREVVTCLRAGERVFVSGDVGVDDGTVVVTAPRGAKLLVCSDDPRELVDRRSREVVLFVGGELLACAVCTTLSLWPPAFGAVSTLGAVLCIAFFLGVTPLGVRLRERCRPADRASLDGVHARPSRG